MYAQPLPALSSPDGSAWTVRVIDGVFEAATCRELIERQIDQRWLTRTADFSRSTRGPIDLLRRFAEPDLPCRLLDDDAPPPFTLIDDSDFEGLETFRLRLTSAAGASIFGTGEATVTITDNESSPSFTVDSPSFNEGDGTGQFTVTLNPSSGTATSVVYTISGGTATSGGTDYSATMSGTLSFGIGVTTQTVPFILNDDNIAEGNETLNITLSTPAGGAVLGTPATGTATIIDNEGTPSLSVDSPVVTEGGSGQFRITLSPTSTKAAVMAVPGTTTKLIAVLLREQAFEALNVGWSSALAIILLLTAIAFTSIYLYILNLNSKAKAKEVAA
ncbi:MAG: hypothetical protein HC927_09565 [Deltaproteobacteria bacterium]|nr:hypothetical protein [Deltaproteobacteria bacterium]